MMERTDKVTMTHYEFECLMREYSKMAIETNHKRYLAKCATLCMNQVATGITSGDDDKKLCYQRDRNYLSIARNCLSK